MKEIYAVVSYYSFDDSPKVDLFDDMEEARAYLLDVAKEEYRIARMKNNGETYLSFDSEYYDEITCATLEEHFDNGIDVSKFSLVTQIVEH